MWVITFHALDGFFLENLDSQTRPGMFLAVGLQQDFARLFVHHY